MMSSEPLCEETNGGTKMAEGNGKTSVVSSASGNISPHTKPQSAFLG